MATVTKTFCDHCGKELDTMIGYHDLDIRLNHVTVNTDLCARCFAELVDIIEKFCNKGNKKDDA